MPVVYVNDVDGRWDADAPGLVRRAIEAGRGGDVVGEVAPAKGDRFVLKPRYSIFDHTPWSSSSRSSRSSGSSSRGAATEMCVVQSAIDARELGFKVTIVADACATMDEELERLTFEYAQRVVGPASSRFAAVEPGRA